MLWRGRRQSGNVDDRRGMSGGGLVTGGGVVGVIIYILYSLMGGDPSQLQAPQARQGQELSTEQQAAEDTLREFVSVVLAETEDAWTSILSQQDMRYEAPVLVLFRGGVQSGCGNAGSETGPFYCPTDRKLYIDLSFYDELRNRFGAAGDFAMAYVVAHEVGHHIQNLLGTSDHVQNLREHMNKKNSNAYSVMLELQADYYAGVWAHYAQQKNNILEEGDIDEALKAASAVGDDNIQKQSQGYVVPDAFTHGSSEQRMYWFKRGYQYGDLEHGNTFEGS